MPGKILMNGSNIMCPHGGKAVLMTSDMKLFSDNAQVLLESDVHPVVGCPFTIGLKYSPCLRIEWTGGSSKAGGIPVLITSSIGKCINAEGVPQGLAIIVSTQTKASAI
jgi:hypothetical protein